MSTYYVVGRDGGHREPRFDRITDRNARLCEGDLGRPLDYALKHLPALTQEVVARFRSGMTTHDLDMLTAGVCADRSVSHRDFGDLAARIFASDLQKSTPASMLEVVEKLSEAGRLSEEFVGIVRRGSARIDGAIVPKRDFAFGCFGIQQMIRSYLLRVEAADGTISVSERPQHTYMRVALALHVCRPDRRGHEAPDDDFDRRLEKAFATYDMLSTHRLTHASPTMFNAGSRQPQLASCFLLTVADDYGAISQATKDALDLSKSAGGIGMNLTRMRSAGALIRSTGGRSRGVQPFLPLLNSGQRFANQGDRRPGAWAVYLETWHSDILEFLEAGRFKTTTEGAPDLKYAMWVNDMYMEALESELGGDEGAAWHLFSPNTAGDLADLYGDKFRAAYSAHVEAGHAVRTVKPSQIIKAWFKTVAQKGNPYVLFKDHINRKSNLSHWRTITQSNLCAEITLPSFFDAESVATGFDANGRVGGKTDDATEYGTCNLAAIPLASYVKDGAVDWRALAEAAGDAVENLDNAIDTNFYPVEACQRSNGIHRPVAVGVIGLADVFAKCGLTFGSARAQALDQAIHAVIYFGAMSRSSRLGEERGNHASHENSPASRGVLQPDLWVETGHLGEGWSAAVAETTAGFLDAAKWDDLRARVKTHLRNGYVTANMPTATSSQVTGQNECFEPFTSNLYTRKTIAGEFFVLNTHLLATLEERGLWGEAMREALVRNGGSVQKIDSVPEDLKRRFKTAREIDQRLLVMHAAARNPFLSQSQSLNFYFREPRLEEMLTVIMQGWKSGLTTGSYYIHTEPAAGARQIGVSRGETVSETASASSGASTGESASEAASASGSRPGFVCTDDVCTSCAV